MNVDRSSISSETILDLNNSILILESSNERIQGADALTKRNKNLTLVINKLKNIISENEEWRKSLGSVIEKFETTQNLSESKKTEITNTIKIARQALLALLLLSTSESDNQKRKNIVAFLRIPQDNSTTWKDVCQWLKDANDTDSLQAIEKVIGKEKNEPSSQDSQVFSTRPSQSASLQSSSTTTPSAPAAASPSLGNQPSSASSSAASAAAAVASSVSMQNSRTKEEAVALTLLVNFEGKFDVHSFDSLLDKVRRAIEKKECTAEDIFSVLSQKMKESTDPKELEQFAKIAIRFICDIEAEKERVRNPDPDLDSGLSSTPDIYKSMDKNYCQTFLKSLNLEKKITTTFKIDSKQTETKEVLLRTFFLYHLCNVTPTDSLYSDWKTHILKKKEVQELLIDKESFGIVTVQLERDFKALECQINSTSPQQRLNKIKEMKGQIAARYKVLKPFSPLLQ